MADVVEDARMSQVNPYFLEPQDLNAMNSAGKSIHFDPDAPSGRYGSGDRWFREAFARSAFRPERCVWPGCDNFSLNAELPVCHDHATKVWAHVEINEAKGVQMVARQDALDALKAKEEAAAADRRASLEKRQETETAPGYVYYIRVGDLIKIGFTTDLGRRMAEYPPNIERLAHHPGTMQVEQNLHAQFRRHRAKGREWYTPAPEIMAHIEKVAAPQKTPHPVAKAKHLPPPNPADAPWFFRNERAPGRARGGAPRRTPSLPA